MVQRQFIFSKSNGQYELVHNGETMAAPSIIIEQLKGKYPTTAADTFLGSTLTIALAGVTDSLRLVDNAAYDRNSVLKGIIFEQSLVDAAPLLQPEYSSEADPDDIVKYFERCHTIKMGRDVNGNDDTIHAYIFYGQSAGDRDTKIRCRFPNEVRLDAKRNNRKYWVEKYSIIPGSAGGAHVLIDNSSGVVEF